MDSLPYPEQKNIKISETSTKYYRIIFLEVPICICNLNYLVGQLNSAIFIHHWGGNHYILKPFRFCDVIHCIALHQINSIRFFIDAMDCINKLAPVIYIFEFAQTEEDISDRCVMNVRQAQRNHYNSEASTPENVTSKNSWQLNDVMYCIALHQINSHHFF